MIMQDEREKIVEYCQKLITNGLTKGTGGNISIYNQKEKLMAISPSGIDYFKTKPEDVVVLDLDGKIVDGNRKPSSEIDMHRIFYVKRPGINSVVHAHSIYSSVLACLNWSIEPIHYLIGYSGKNVRCTKYCTFGTAELAYSAYEGMKDRNAVILGNHGLLAVGTDIAKAFDTLEEIEFCAEIYYKAKIAGKPVVLSDGDMDIVLDKFKSYGQKK
ncbi:L-fuculose-phosphate aldolase [Pectinatus frisingensis]|uniref:L-fuculose-phosphate aldolase n=1 Tax=Pectinatus frisingensis TaxID=865 RepID=UPI0018C72369|nr:L-fuculose-phosphate aldolase [Pectinatus frisingensis]